MLATAPGCANTAGAIQSSMRGILCRQYLCVGSYATPFRYIRCLRSRCVKKIRARGSRRRNRDRSAARLRYRYRPRLATQALRISRARLAPQDGSDLVLERCRRVGPKDWTPRLTIRVISDGFPPSSPGSGEKYPACASGPRSSPGRPVAGDLARGPRGSGWPSRAHGAGRVVGRGCPATTLNS